MRGGGLNWDESRCWAAVYTVSVTGEAELLSVSRGPCPMQLLILTEEVLVDLGMCAEESLVCDQ